VSQSLWVGIVLNLIAGLMAGACMLPLKFNREWRWENTWLIFSLVSLFVLPWILALSLVNHLFQTYNALTAAQFAIPIFFGAGWGIAQVLFGVSIQRLGLALAYAIVVGLGTLLGTLVPLFVQHRARVGRGILIQVLAGIVVMLIGIGLSTWAGQIRERPHERTTTKRVDAANAQSSLTSGYLTAVLLAILCGLMAPMLNFSFAFGQDIAHQAVRLGNSELRAAYAVWPIGLAGGSLPNVAYSLYLLRRKRSWKMFRLAWPDTLLPIFMGVLWMGAFAFYGMSSTYLGFFGTSIGRGLFQIFMIMTAILSGVWAGEWKSAPRTSIVLLLLGFGCLTAATALLAMGNH
jgi:multidrug transporter EmrE-like cation transporter